MYASAKGFFVMAMATEPKRSIRSKVDQRAATGCCLHCDEPIHRRGLCTHHYHEFRVLRAERSPDSRSSWEDCQIRDGKILSAGYILGVGRSSPFESEG